MVTILTFVQPSSNQSQLIIWTHFIAIVHYWYVLTLLGLYISVHHLFIFTLDQSDINQSILVQDKYGYWSVPEAACNLRVYRIIFIIYVFLCRYFIMRKFIFKIYKEGFTPSRFCTSTCDNKWYKDWFHVLIDRTHSWPVSLTCPGNKTETE